MKIKLLNILFGALLLLGVTGVQAQFSIGHTTVTFNDPNRSGGFGSGGGAGRQIQTEIYYPAASAGDNVPVSAGEFPVVVIGHGFVMSWDAYANIWGLLVAQGYVVALPRTEGTFSPSHGDFGLDLTQVLDKMFEQGNNAASLFYNKLSDTGAIMGHSMGGGASFLAGAQSQNVTTIVGLAPAETNPSAIAAAAIIDVPVLVFSGSDDAVTPPQDHHIPIYNGANSSCKYLINITGGGHCYFANANTNCDFGELVSGLPPISRAAQQAIMNQYLLPWLNWWLKNDAQAALEFQTLLPAASNVTFQENCVLLSTPELNVNQINLYPNPANQHVVIDFAGLKVINDAEISVYALDGRIVKSIEMNTLNTGYIFPVSDLKSGVYHFDVRAKEGRWITRFIKD
jgi:dienelactone hydrolase